VDRRHDGVLGPGGYAPGEGEIAAFERTGAAMVGELEGEPKGRAVALGDPREAAGILVEGMYDAGPLDAADARQAGAAMGDQRVDQGAGWVACGRMDHQASRLVDHDQVGVFVDDGERNGLWPGRGLF